MAQKCSVLGAGSWGTALAVHLARSGHEVMLWDRHEDRCEQMNVNRKNPRYLRDVTLPESLTATPDLEMAASFGKLVVTGVPSHGLRDVMSQAGSFLRDDVTICCATKGVEEGTLMTMHQLLEDVLPDDLQEAITILAGPSFAFEVANGLPTAVVIGGAEAPAHFAAETFHSESFRAYHTEDVAGCCLGGSIKNVMAIACGVSDGIGLGGNARAAIITRGLAETSRLAVAFGANPLTMMGLAGLGDLVLTCTGDLSRNRRVGLALAKGLTLPQVLEELGEVAEGVRTAKSAKNLAKTVGVELPLTEQVYRVLYEDLPVVEALAGLMGRARRAERDDGGE